LRAIAAAERTALPGWPLHHVPGNHDLHPTLGGLEAWAATLGNSSAGPHARGGSHTAHSHRGRGRAHYRALRRDGWRLLLLDSASAVGKDTLGYGHVGGEQLRWLERQLELSAAADEQVIIIAHQLLVVPTDANNNAVPWFTASQDLIDNADEVLAVFGRFSHVRLSLHGHVHANSVTTRGGIPFVTTASADEYPMAWREIIVRKCEIELRMRHLTLPTLRDMSATRETRGINAAKLGGLTENNVVLPLRGRCGHAPLSNSERGELRTSWPPPINEEMELQDEPLWPRKAKRGGQSSFGLA
jgi:hypothetical protein